jgi:hypothetical protein
VIFVFGYVDLAQDLSVLEQQALRAQALVDHRKAPVARCRRGVGAAGILTNACRSGPSSANARPPPTQSTSSSPRQQSERMPGAGKPYCLNEATPHGSAQLVDCRGPATRDRVVHGDLPEFHCNLIRLRVN